jgi:hypothetical protein
MSSLLGPQTVVCVWVHTGAGRPLRIMHTPFRIVAQSGMFVLYTVPPR